jgi:Rieske Fe-S protein
VADQTVTRRSIVTGFAVAAVGGVAGFVVARNSSAAKRVAAGTAANGYGYSAPSGGGKLLIQADQVPNGGGVILADDQIVLTRDQTGTLHSFSAICTHQGCTVASVNATAISCPCHGSRFNAQTGAVLNGPAVRPLPSVVVVVRDGGVYTS